MKTFIRCFILVLSFSFANALLANTVIIKGTVKDSANHPVTNRAVRIYNADSSGCNLSHTVYTNANGYYIDTLNCSGALSKLNVVVENCNGARIVRDPNVTASGIVEVNFVICTGTPPPASCKAVFTFAQAATGVKFTAGASTAPAGDSIIGYYWSFGDTTTPGKGTKDPLHLYAQAGKYNVCVTIKTKNGCENTYCTTVEYKPAQESCKAVAVIGVEKLGPKKFRFTSAQSTVLAGDSITQRIWTFGDGTSTDGNKVIVEKEFKDTAAYTVCLKIVTAKGCDNKTCTTVNVHDTVPPVPVNCKASFTYSIKDSVIVFNSAASVASSTPGDSIVSRIWSYTDSANNVSLGGNVIAPSYVYAKPGTYKVTLTIKTKYGCESKTSVNVTIPPAIPSGCKASFTFTVQEGSVKFISNSHGVTATDSIVSYTWIFGDSTVPVSGSRDPMHVYVKSGKYSVTLYIKTKSGCESKYTESVNISLHPPVACAAEAKFSSERVSARKIRFNSNTSLVNSGDSIIQRSWKFGDGTALAGNTPNPLKEYAQAGIYSVCLEIKTAGGCTAQICQNITVQDSVTTPQSSVDFIKIISLNPNPVTTRMIATIYSRNTNAEAEIVVYDIYGSPKLTLKKLLLQGNNTVEINTGNLYHGPYFLKVSTRSGKDSKAFYKL